MDNVASLESTIREAYISRRAEREKKAERAYAKRCYENRALERYEERLKDEESMRENSRIEYLLEQQYRNTFATNPLGILIDYFA